MKHKEVYPNLTCRPYGRILPAPVVVGDADAAAAAERPTGEQKALSFCQ